jgi:hypothetical protein
VRGSRTLAQDRMGLLREIFDLHAGHSATVVPQAPVRNRTLIRGFGFGSLAASPSTCALCRQLLQAVWGHDYYGDDRVVDVHIRTLRRALGDDAANPAYIATIRSIGYRLIG